MKPKIGVLALVLISVFTCVSLAFASGLGTVVVKSTPPGASVQIGKTIVGKTPATLKLPEGSSTKLLVKKAGFKPKVVVVSPKKNKVTHVKVTLSP
jgi:hypothetical protein